MLEHASLAVELLGLFGFGLPHAGLVEGVASTTLSRNLSNSQAPG